MAHGKPMKGALLRPTVTSWASADRRPPLPVALLFQRQIVSLTRNSFGNRSNILLALSRKSSQIRGCHPLQGAMAADVFARATPHGFPEMVVVGKPYHRVRQSRDITRRYQTAVAPLDHLLGRAADIGGDDGQPGGKRFERG